MSDNDETSPTSWQILRSSEYWLLLVSVVVAGFGVSGWVVIPATLAGLLISSLPKYAPLYHRARQVGADTAFWATVASSIIIGVLASAGAFVSGRLAWWMWGL